MIDDPTYLRHQYRDDANLNARAALHERFSVNPERFPRWLFDALRLPGRARVLEVGAGPGLPWRANLERVPEGWRVVLSDRSPGMVRAAHDALRGDGRFEYEVADAAAIPHPDRTFDAAVANHMLYHVPDRARAIAELARVLRPDGALYAATNGRGHMREIDELIGRHGFPVEDRWSHAFGLENGAEQLGAAFGDVELRPYEDALAVDEPEPVVAYALSTVPSDRLDVDAMRREIAGTIARDGSFRVHKATGLFVARSPIQSSP